ncbi:MAG: helix-turn-helix transcriptional regulator [Flavobacteriales bacterium]
MYTFIDQAYFSRPRSVNTGRVLNRSELTQVDSPLPVRGVGVKYVIRGLERYRMNGKHYVVESGNYLLVNAASTGGVAIDSTDPVIGLCAQLPFDLMMQAVSSYAKPEDLDVAEAEHYFTTDRFVTSLCNGRATHTGAWMGALAKHPLFSQRTEHAVDDEVFLTLADALVRDHVGLFEHLRSIQVVRSSTRREMHRRVELAIAFIHGSYASSISVRDMARAASMSEFHFHRVFRAIKGVPPHRYLNEVRMRRADELLRAGREPILDVALQCGFVDLATFSKAFKRSFGHAPSTVRGSRSI